MSHAIGIENGVPKAVFQDTRTLRFTCHVDPHGHLEVGTNRARPELILDRETAGQLGRWLLAFEATGALTSVPPSLAALAAAVEDQAARIDRIADNSMDLNIQVCDFKQAAMGIFERLRKLEQQVFEPL